MRNNIQNDVKVEKAKNYLSKFNMSRSVSTSASIGRVNVGWAQYMIPGSKALVSEEQLVRMAPMVAPTYAKQKFKTWHTFIPFADVFKNFDAMMSEQTISRNGVLMNPSKVPHINSRVLFALACTGAKFSIYLQTYSGGSYNENMQTTMINKYSGGSDDNYKTLINYIVTNALGWEAGSLTDGPKINVGRIFNLSDQNMKTESGNKTFSSFVLPDDDGTMPPWYNYETAGYDVLNPVTLEGADFIYQIPVYNVSGSGVPSAIAGDYTITLAIRLSSWGQNFTNTLRALGYIIDPSSDENVSVLPLLAAYKAYWDIFGLALWQNFESTSCSRFITLCENISDVDVYETSGAWNRFKSFVLDELGAMWLTEQNDYISAHLPQPVISEPSNMTTAGFVDVIGSLPISEPNDNDYAHQNQPTAGQPDGHAFTTSINHGALDSELLKRLYKWTNRNTALGKDIARLLSAQNLGTYMERTRCNYIGDTSMDIDVTSVTSVADTFDDATKQGKMLGSYSGKGVGYKEHGKKLYYSTDCFGIWICLTAVTCDSGYSQGADLLNESIKPEQFYRPDFDGLGLEIHDKSLIAGQIDCSIYGYSQPPHALAFGYAPRYSSWKVARNIVNGGFALRSVRKNYVPYNMDKLIYPEQVDCTDVTSINPPSSSGIFAGGEKHLMCRTLPVQDVPTAGNSWRFLGRYPWMANLNRIFANVGETMPADLYTGSISAGLARFWEYRYLTDDNYMVFEDVVFKYWAPMLPIEETYGTIDPDAKQLEYIDRV